MQYHHSIYGCSKVWMAAQRRVGPSYRVATRSTVHVSLRAVGSIDSFFDCIKCARLRQHPRHETSSRLCFVLHNQRERNLHLFVTVLQAIDEHLLRMRSKTDSAKSMLRRHQWQTMKRKQRTFVERSCKNQLREGFGEVSKPGSSGHRSAPSAGMSPLD